MEERLKTLSKHFYDDEILYKSKSGEIHLKIGVKRRNFNNSHNNLSSDKSDEHINYDVIINSKIKEFEEMNDIKEYRRNDEIDNWDTE